MNLETWVRVGDYALEVAGPGNFRAVEIAAVGRSRRGADGRIVRLQAPPPQLFRNAILLRDKVLQPLRAAEVARPIHVSSWYRDAAYNASIPGSATNSTHTLGIAADIGKQDWHPLRVALWLHHHHPLADKLGIGYYPPDSRRGTPGFVHVDCRGLIGRPAPARFGGPPKAWWEAPYSKAPR